MNTFIVCHVWSHSLVFSATIENGGNQLQFCLIQLYFDGPAETVTYRIFYYINRSGNGRLTFRELRRGNLIDAMLHADEEEDINKVLRY